MDMTQAVQNAKTRSDHEALAKHYEEAAKVMQDEADTIKGCWRNTRQTRASTVSKPKRL